MKQSSNLVVYNTNHVVFTLGAETVDHANATDGTSPGHLAYQTLGRESVQGADKRLGIQHGSRTTCD